MDLRDRGQRRRRSGRPPRRRGLHRAHRRARSLTYVFCNSCGHRNPPESAFCSSCGSPLDSLDDRTIKIERGRPVARRASGSADDIEVPVSSLPADTAVLIVRVRRPGGGALRARGATSPASAATPTARSCSTTSPCRAGTSTIERTPTGLRGQRRRVAERHLRQPASVSTGRCCTTVTSCRSASSASCFFERPMAEPGRPRLPLDRRGARPAARGVPRRHDLQDPVPREPGPDRAGAHAVGLPQVLRATTSSCCASSCASSGRTTCRSASSRTASTPARSIAPATPPRGVEAPADGIGAEARRRRRTVAGCHRSPPAADGARPAGRSASPARQRALRRTARHHADAAERAGQRRRASHHDCCRVWSSTATSCARWRR